MKSYSVPMIACFFFYLLLALYVLCDNYATTPLSSATLSDSILQRGIADSVLRFHCLANSDSAEDQAVKLQVRDAVCLYMQNNLPQTESKEETIAMLQPRLQEMQQIANDTLTTNGFDYHADVRLVTTDFPSKTYGTVTLPAGQYDCLQILLGEHKGANCWCILFPRLCITKEAYELIPEESMKQLSSVLTEEEFSSLFEKKPKVKVKSRLLDWLVKLFGGDA